MSAEFDLALIRAQLQLCFSFSSTTTTVFSSHSFITALLALFCMTLCFYKQRLNLFLLSSSMRLRPKRTYSGAECFGGFIIKQRFFYLLLFLRGPHT